jgi:CheY-like chemotaxis protein
MAGDERPIYSIGAIERMLGLPAATIRNWELRYGLVTPHRSDGGHRLYTRSQVEQLRFLKVEVERGLQPAQAHRLLADQLASHGPLPAGSDAMDEPQPLILIADRDPYAAELSEFFLRTEGYDVALAGDVAASERALERRVPELAVVEIMISGGTGARLCRELKDHGVSFCVAVSALDAREAALGAGADAFLGKPLDPLELVSTVKDLLGGSALLRGRARERR